MDNHFFSNLWDSVGDEKNQVSGSFGIVCSMAVFLWLDLSTPQGFLMLFTTWVGIIKFLMGAAFPLISFFGLKVAQMVFDKVKPDLSKWMDKKYHYIKHKLFKFKKNAKEKENNQRRA